MDDHVALVTGASSGIGEATAQAFAAEGMSVAVAARREKRLHQLTDQIEEEHDVDTLAVPVDVRDERAIHECVETVVDTLGQLDILVSNAGVIRGSGVESFETDDYRTVMETNVDGTFFLTKAAMPHLRNRSGCVVYVGSFDSKYPRSFNPVYAASKWWLRGYAHSVAANVGNDDVAVSLINPSKVRTEIGSAYGEPFEEKYEPGEVLNPEHIAEAIAFAATREGSSISEMDVFALDKYSREKF